MSETLVRYLLAAGALIIAGLSVIAGYYLWQLYRLRQAQKIQLETLKNESDAQRQRINTSIQVIAGSLGREDLSLTEASIRISVLLDSLSVAESVREEYSAFYQLRDATAHIPILDRWNSLPLPERRKLEQQRLRHEKTYGEFVLAAAERIRGKTF